MLCEETSLKRGHDLSDSKYTDIHTHQGENRQFSMGGICEELNVRGADGIPRFQIK